MLDRENIIQTPHAVSADRLLCFALDIGEGMLKSGGEIHRVEDTLERICRAYGAEHTEIFAIPSLILAAVRMPNGEYSSQIRRIRTIGNDLYRLELWNAVSRRICRETPCPEQVHDMICQAKSKRAYPAWLGYPAAALAAGTFAVFFGGSWRDGCLAALIGLAVFGMDRLPFRQMNRLAKLVLQSFLSGVLACLSVFVGLGQNVGTIMIGTIMLIIPGLSFGTALRDLLCGDILAGTLKIVQCGLSALLIAAGYLLAMLVTGGAMR